jgi:hypothetical protein
VRTVAAPARSFTLALRAAAVSPVVVRLLGCCCWGLRVWTGRLFASCFPSIKMNFRPCFFRNPRAPRAGVVASWGRRALLSCGCVACTGAAPALSFGAFGSTRPVTQRRRGPGSAAVQPPEAGGTVNSEPCKGLLASVGFNPAGIINVRRKL